MSSSSDRSIFITGVVGRAMGSGKFGWDDIPVITERASQAFEATFGKVEAPAPQAPQPRNVGHAQSVAAISSAVLGKSAPFTAWSGEKARYGSGKWKPHRNTKLYPEITWGEWLDMAKDGDEEALKILNTIASSDPGPAGGKWELDNKVKISRAQAVLQLIKGE